MSRKQRNERKRWGYVAVFNDKNRRDYDYLSFYAPAKQPSRVNDNRRVARLSVQAVRWIVRRRHDARPDQRHRQASGRHSRQSSISDSASCRFGATR